MAGSRLFAGSVFLYQDQGVDVFPINYDNFRKLSLQLEPLTLPYQDAEGHTIQLWKTTHDNLVGTVSCQQGSTKIVPGNKIINPLNPTEKAKDLVHRLQNVPLRKWDIALDVHRFSLSIWPHLEAEGKHIHYELYKHMSVEEIVKAAKKRLFDNQKPGERWEKRRMLSKGESSEPQEPPEKKDLKEHSLKPKEPPKKKKHGALNHEHYDACRKEFKGEQVGEGKPDGHIKEVVGALNSLTNLITTVKEILRDRKGLNPQDKKELEGVISEASRTMDKAFNRVPSLRHFISKKSHQESVQQNHLTDTYNQSNPKHPISESGASGGSIGGVGIAAGMIEGLFDTLCDFEEMHHYFHIPSQNGKPPFSDEELQQILRELAVGIYLHDTAPFFSLHFNKERHLYPIIHPAYQNTLVGRVMSLLDYYMKGFLNGSFFDEGFIAEWQQSKTQDKEILKKKCIDFHQYCEEEGHGYLSVNGKIQILEPEGNSDEPDCFSNYSGFRSSFRIISKQNSCKKFENLFLLDGDFDVFYTIEPDAAYEEELSKFRHQKGHDPAGYTRLIYAYEYMKYQIQTVMPQLPKFKELFEQLKVIDSFSHYYRTLKSNQKIPLLDPSSSKRYFGCFPLFPHIPVERIQTQRVSFCLEEILSELSQKEQQRVSDYLNRIEEGENPPSDLVDLLIPHFTACVKSKVSLLLPKIFTQNHKEILSKNLKKILKLSRGRAKKTENQLMSQPKKRKGNTVDCLESARYIEIPFMQNGIAIEYDSEPHQRGAAFSKSIVGGCGLNLQDLHVTHVTAEPSNQHILDQAIFDLNQDGKEKMIPVQQEGQHCADGFVFKLSLADFYATNSRDYAWVSDLLTQEDQKTLHMRNHLFTLIQEGEGERLETIVDQFDDLHFQDNQGVFPIHYAAASELDFLNILAPRSDLTLQDVNGYTPLHYAAKEGKVDNAVFLFENSPKTLNQRSFNGSTPLYVAVQHNRTEVVSKLLELGSYVNWATVYGMTPLHCAIHNGCKQLATKLLNHPEADVNMELEDGTTLLHLACDLGMKDVVKNLLKRGAKIDARRKDDYAPLHIVVKRGMSSICRILLEHAPNKVDISLKSGKTALHLAAENGHRETVCMLLKYKANHGSMGWDKHTPLIEAIYNGNVEIAHDIILDIIKKKLSLELINNQTPEGDTPLLAALRRRQYGVVECLLQQKVKIVDELDFVKRLCREKIDPHFILSFMKSLEFNNKTLGEIFYASSSSGHNQMVSLLEHHYSVTDFGTDANGWTVVHFAAKFDHLSVIQAFLDSDPDDLLQLTKKENKSIAAIAAENGSSRVLQRLLNVMQDKGIAFDQQYKGKHLLLAPIEADQEMAVETIIRMIGDPNIFLDQDHLTAAHYAAKFGQVEILELLRVHGADFSQMDKSSKTPIHYAFEYQWDDAIDYCMNIKNEFTLPENLEGGALEVVDEEESSPLVTAILEGNVEDVRTFLENGADPNHMDRYRSSPLMYAVASNQVRSVRLLLEYGSNVNQPCFGKKRRPLLVAIEEGYESLVKLMVTEGADIHVTDIRGTNPVHKAAEVGNVGILRFLHAAGASLEAEDREGKTVVHYAVSSGKSEVIDYLLENQISLNKSTRQAALSVRETKKEEQGVTPLHLAANGGHLDVVKTLIDGGANVGMRTRADRSALVFAAQSRSKETLKFFMNFRVAETLEQQHSAIRAAISHNSLSQLKILFPSIRSCIHQQLDQQGSTALHIAASNGSFRCAYFLVNQGADPHKQDFEGQTPFGLAIENGHTALVRYFAKKSDLFDSDIMGEKEKLYLHRSCELGNVQMTALLLLYGASIEEVDQSAVLQIAIKQKHKKLVHLLLAVGADSQSIQPKLFNSADSNCKELLEKYKKVKQSSALNGDTPLHVAVRFNDVEHFALLCHLYDLDVKNKEGMTPLHLAVLGKNLEIIRKLVDHDADLESKNHERKTPLHSAMLDVRDFSIVRSLVKAGSSLSVMDQNGQALLHELNSMEDRMYVTRVIDLVNRSQEMKMDPSGNVLYHSNYPTEEAEFPPLGEVEGKNSCFLQ